METFTICLVCERLNRIPLGGGSVKVTNCGGCKLDLSFRDGVTDANAKGLKALISKSPNPVIVNFESTKSEGTKTYSSTFIDVAMQWCGQVTFVKINLDKEPAVGEQYKVWSTPQTVMFRNEAEVSRKSGVISQADLTAWIRGFLASY